jgi:glycerate dehydrogenase
MQGKPPAVFLDFETLGPGVDTGPLDALLSVRYHPHAREEETVERLAGCRVAIANKARLTSETIAAASGLELIALTATGTDNVDTEAAREHGVAVANIRDYCSTSVAQHVFALVLGLTQQIGRFDALVRSGGWQRSRSFALFDYPVRELSGRTLGIVGYGALGKAVARMGTCLGLEPLIAARPHAAPGGPLPEGRAAFETVLEASDVLSLHCPLTESTRNLIGTVELARMKRDAILINTSRGGLVDTEALIDALRRGEIGGAGIDVLPVEPPRPEDQALLEGAPPNLIVTPHVAWSAREARQRALDQVAENVADFLAGGTLRRVV